MVGPDHESNPRLQDEFRRRRLINTLVMVATFAAIVVFINELRPGHFMAASPLGYTALALGLPISFISVWKWRCPACNFHFGGALNPRLCRSCGLKFGSDIPA